MENEQKSLSKLSPKSKKELLDFLKHYTIEYRDTIGLNNQTTFGIEIEYVTKDSKAMYIQGTPTLKIKKTIPKDDTLYNTCWQNVPETNANSTNNINGIEYGAELTSSILTDEIKSWQEIKEACELLRQHEMYVNNRCGGHIHFGATQQFKEDLEKIIRFFKIYAVYEDILIRFGLNDNEEVRQTIETCARPISLEIIDKLNVILPSDDLASALNELSSDHAAINIIDYADLCSGSYVSPSGTIEVRSPDGTLDEVRWQNNINAYGKLLEYSVGSEYDTELIDYQYKYKTATEYPDYKLLKFDKALEFADIIFDTDIDKYNFLAQYVKEKPKKKLNIKILTK